MTHIPQPGRAWAYTGAILGGSVSIAANVAHSFLPPLGAPVNWAPEPGAVVGAIVWPVFLFVAVEILARTHWPKGFTWQVMRFGGLLPVALVAAFVSYRHLSGLLAHYGEEPIVSFFGPLAVDGLMIMATGALLAGGRAARTSAHVPVEPAPAHVSAPVPVSPVHPVAPVATLPATPPPAVVASVVAVPRPVETPAPPVVPAQPSARVESRQRPDVVPAPPARSATDTVTASGPVPRPPSITPGFLAKARHVVEGHRKATGEDITAGALAVRLHINSERAAQILAALGDSKDTPVLATAATNGTAVGRPSA